MSGLTPEWAFIYIDDVVVIGCSAEHHLENLAKVFDRLRMYNLKLNPEKCKRFRTTVTYLSYKLTDEAILHDDSKYAVVKNLPKLITVDDIRCFVAFCNYFRKCVPNLADIAKPLNNQLRKNAKFN